jgi:ADP-heptose:LPS heptosyltransferase
VPVVALFGPTAAAEVDLQGNGTKILSDLDCLCCYRTTCTRQPSCMERIAPERVLQECAVLLARRGWERQAATA